MIVFCVMLPNALWTQTTFNYSPQNGNWGIANNVFYTDTGYVVFGSGGSFLSQRKLRIIQLDKNGTFFNEKMYGQTNTAVYTGYYESGTVINESPRFVISGSLSLANNVSKGTLFFINDELDSSSFVTSNNYRWQNISQSKWNTRSKQLISAGIVHHPALVSRFWVIKSDSTGTTTWDTLIGDNVVKNTATSIGLSSDGGYVVGGWTDLGVPNAEGKSNIRIIKFNAKDSIEWDTYLGDSLSEAVFSVFESKFGGYFAGGGRTDYSNVINYKEITFTTPYIIKLDSFGKVVWEKSYNRGRFNFGLFSLKENADGSLIGCGAIPGKFYKEGVSGTYGYVIKVSKDGELLWERVHHLPEAFDPESQVGVYARLYSIKPTPDGGYIACGQTNTAEGNTDFWVLKMDDRGCVGTPCDVKEAVLALEEKYLEKGIGNFSVFPNPAKDKVHIEFGIPTSENMNLQIFDQSGKLVFEQLIEKGSNEITLTNLDCESGLYLVYLYSKKTSFPVQKLIIQR